MTSHSEEERKPYGLDNYRTDLLKKAVGLHNRMGNARLCDGGSALVDELNKENLDKYNAFLFIGVTGSGKTWAGHALLHYLCSKENPRRLEDNQPDTIDRRMKVLTAYDIEQLIVQSDYDALEKLKTVPLLFIDDLGTEANRFKSDDFKATFNILINERYNYTNRVTIISTNHTVKSLGETYGERFLSRMREIGCIKSAGNVDMRKRPAV